MDRHILLLSRQALAAVHIYRRTSHKSLCVSSCHWGKPESRTQYSSGILTSFSWLCQLLALPPKEGMLGSMDMSIYDFLCWSQYRIGRTRGHSGSGPADVAPPGTLSSRRRWWAARGPDCAPGAAGRRRRARTWSCRCSAGSPSLCASTAGCQELGAGCGRGVSWPSREEGSPGPARIVASWLGQQRRGASRWSASGAHGCR